MARIVFAGELGATDGYLGRTLPVAESLRAEGHSVSFVVPDLPVARRLLTPKRFGFFPAPRLGRSLPGSRQPSEYAQILFHIGYASRDSLRAYVTGWLTLWRNTDVDAIVIDHAPTALLAARIVRKPALLFGTGSGIPPDMEGPADAPVVATINQVAGELGGAPIHRLADLFAELPCLLTTFAELDPYGPRPGMTFNGPMDRDDGETVQWHSSDRSHVLAQLRADLPAFETVLAALRETPAETICVVANASTSLLHRLRDCPIRVFSNPLNLDSLLRAADAVVCDGDAGLIARSLCAGVPLLTIPGDIEQQWNSQRATALGASIVLDPRRSVADVRSALHEILTRDVYRQAARSFARAHSSFEPEQACKRATEAVLRVACSGRSNRDVTVTPLSPVAQPSSPPLRRILYVWELGANAGHLERGVAVAEHLRSQDMEVIFAVRQLSLAQRLLESHRFSYVECPSLPVRPPQRAAVNYSDLLLDRGFGNPTAVSACVHAWSELYRVLRPDVAILDYSPMAQLAAYVSGLPTILLGSGFSIPPNTHPLPSIQPRKAIRPQQLLLADRRLLDILNRVIGEFSAAPLPRVGALFARSPQILTTFQELDPYSNRDTGDYVGPTERATSYTRTEWHTAGRVRVFAYLRPLVRGLEALFQALRAIDAEVKCALPGASEALVNKYRSDRLRIFTEPIEVAPLLPEADVVVTYGSAGLLAQSLLAGVPVLMLCEALEQITNSMRVVEMGAGIAVIEHRTPAALVEALTKLTSQASYKDAARAFAKRYRNRDGTECSALIVKRLNEVSPRSAASQTSPQAVPQLAV